MAKAIGASSIPASMKGACSRTGRSRDPHYYHRIGADYQADQLTALSTGGKGAFHHASEPGEISEIVIGEPGGVGHGHSAKTLVVAGSSGMAEWTLLGGHAEQSGARGTVHFDRIARGKPCVSWSWVG